MLRGDSIVMEGKLVCFFNFYYVSINYSNVKDSDDT